MPAFKLCFCCALNAAHCSRRRRRRLSTCVALLQGVDKGVAARLVAELGSWAADLTPDGVAQSAQRVMALTQVCHHIMGGGTHAKRPSYLCNRVFSFFKKCRPRAWRRFNLQSRKKSTEPSGERVCEHADALHCKP